MRARPHPRNASRLESLRSYAVLDSPRTRDFDEIAELAAVLCDVPMVAISLVDSDRQWFLAECGVGVRSTPIEVSVCAHTILGPTFLEVPDLTDDARFSDNPLVTGEMGIRFYAGAQLVSPDGMPLGTLCALDRVPRTLTDAQRTILKALARRVMAELEVHRQAQQVADLAARLVATRDDRQRMLGMVSRDLRKSLNTISLSARMMARGAGGPPNSAFTQRMRRATQHMQRLVDQLSEPQRGPRHAVSSSASTDISTVVRSAVDAARSAAKASGITLNVVMAEDVGRAAWAVAHVRRVLNDVIATVLRATAPGQWVSVLVEAVADDIMVDVVGLGPSTPPAELVRLFEAANAEDVTRMDDAANVDQERTSGAALAIARDRVEGYGGTLTACGMEGQGTQVRIRWPRTASFGASHASA